MHVRTLLILIKSETATWTSSFFVSNKIFRIANPSYTKSINDFLQNVGLIYKCNFSKNKCNFSNTKCNKKLALVISDAHQFDAQVL